MRRYLGISRMVWVLVIVLALFVPAGIAERAITDASGQLVYVLNGADAAITGSAEKPGGELVMLGDALYALT